jgi:hypothetical protein
MAIYALSATAAILWGIFVAPGLVDRGREIHLGKDCWTTGYRDPITGQTVASTKDKAMAESCLTQEGR